MTAGEVAAAKGHLGTVDALLDAGLYVDRPNAQRKTALHEVASTPQLEAAALLLARGANPNARAEDELTPLHLTAFGNQQSGEMAEQLLAAGAEVNARNKYEATPLVLAARQGNLQVIQSLLDAGADPTLAAVEDMTPLKAARGNGRKEAAGLLEEWTRERMSR